jgi:hypothetical protein
MQICCLQSGNNHGYFFAMKIPISIHDYFFEAAVRLARRLGIPRGELQSHAASQIVDENQALGIRERLDAVYAADSESSQIDPVMTRLQIESLPEADW